MKKANILLTIAFTMLVITIAFVIYAFGHPEFSFLIPLYAVKIIYTIYVGAMVILFILGFVLKRKKK